jgi:hypothetical protein
MLEGGTSQRNYLAALFKCRVAYLRQNILFTGFTPFEEKGIK